MSGRMEQENKIKTKIEEKLIGLPTIFTNYYSYLEADDKSYGTCLHYISYIADFMEYILQGKIDENFYEKIDVQQIRDYIISLKRRSENGTEVRNGDSIQCTRWSGLNSFFGFLVMDDYITVNPMAKVKRPKNRTQKEIVYLERDEIDQIIDTIKKEAQDKMVNRDIALVTLGITTGLRVSALININIEDINWKTNEIATIEKGGKTRIIKFGEKTRATLAQWMIDRSAFFNDVETNALFISQWKRRITDEGVRKLLKKYTAGLDKHITAHSMRKSCATQAYMAGNDIRTIASMLGHASVNTTMRYAAAVDSKQEQMVDSLDNLF